MLSHIMSISKGFCQSATLLLGILSHRYRYHKHFIFSSSVERGVLLLNLLDLLLIELKAEPFYVISIIS